MTSIYKPLLKSTRDVQSLRYDFSGGWLDVRYGSQSVMHFRVKKGEMKHLREKLDNLKALLTELLRHADRPYIENIDFVVYLLSSAGYIVDTCGAKDFIVYKDGERGMEYYLDAKGLVDYSREVGVLK